MKYIIRVFVYICLLLVGAACNSQSKTTFNEKITSSPIPRILTTSTPVSIRATEVASLTPSSIAMKTTPTHESPKSKTATSTSPVEKFLICSPLEHETLLSLSEIVSDPYHPPPPGHDERHHGVDFSYYQHGSRNTIEGEGIQSILPGFVNSVIIDRLPYGNMVIIETPASLLPTEYLSTFGISEGESLYHLYAHLQLPPLVQLGDEVECGQLLGSVGMTGYNIVNPHLHLETRIGPSGIVFTEMAFYTTSATINEMENYKHWRTSGDFRHFDPMSLFDYFLRN